MNIASPKLANTVDRASSRPRVLHIFGALSFGGLETWLMHMFRHRERFGVDHEILLTKTEVGCYEEEVRKLGIPIHRLTMDSGRIRWLRSLRSFLRSHGPYQIVHSHAFLFSAAVLEVARSAGVPVRIAHSHSAFSRGSDHKGLVSGLRRLAASVWMKRAATCRIGISDIAIEEIAGPRWRSDPAASVLLYGFDFSPYRGAEKRAGPLRKRLGIARDAPVVGHVGRFEPVKNHEFLIAAFAELRRTLSNAQLVLVGDGRIRDAVAARVKAAGLSDCVHFAGTSHDIPAYMAMFDLFVLPSFSEGLGIVVVEAQAAGTPAIVSDGVASEAAVVEGAVDFLPLSAGPKLWASRMTELLSRHAARDPAWLDQVEASRFAIGRCIDELDRIYLAELARAR